MGKHAAIDDLFGHVPQADELFGPKGSDCGPMPVTGPIVHSPETIRAEMHRILGEVRGASSLTWTSRVLRGNTALFPYMAEWLDEQEGKQLLLDLKAELDRLGAPVEEMGPNWQKMWNAAP